MPYKVKIMTVTTGSVAVKYHNAYVENYHTCSGIFNEPVNAGMDNADKSRSDIYDVYFCLP